MTRTHTLIFASLLLILPATALSQPTQRERPGPGGGRFMQERGMQQRRPMGQHMKRNARARMDQGKKRLLEELNLSDEQKETLKTIKDNHREEVSQIREELQSAKEALRSSLRDPDQGSSEATPLLNRVTDLSSKLHKNRISMLLEIKEHLTKEQRAKAVSLMENFKEQRGGGMGRPGGPRGPKGHQGMRPGHKGGKGGPRGRGGMEEMGL